MSESLRPFRQEWTAAPRYGVLQLMIVEKCSNKAGLVAVRGSDKRACSVKTDQ